MLPPSAVHLGYALDLALLVPAYTLAAVLLWKRAAWGYVLAGSLLPFTAAYQLNYVTALVFQAGRGCRARWHSTRKRCRSSPLPSRRLCCCSVVANQRGS